MNRSEIFSSIVNDFATATAAWHDALLPIAIGLFWALAAIEISWSAMWWTLEREDPTAMIAAFLRKIVALMFFYTLLVYFRDWSFVVLDSFAEAGRRASGLPMLDPSTVLDQGIAVSGNLLRRVFDAGLVAFAGGGAFVALAGLIVFLAFVLIAVQMALTLVEAYFVLGAGVFMLGFSGSRFTAPFASRFLSFALGIGVKLFTVYLVVGVGMSLAPGWVSILDQSGQSLGALLQILGASILYAFLAWSIPNLAASTMNGAVSLTLTDASMAGSAINRASSRVSGAASATAAPVLNILARVRHAVAPTSPGSGRSGASARTTSSSRSMKNSSRAQKADQSNTQRGSSESAEKRGTGRSGTKKESDK
ncbi:MAG: P-type conjugative transfer protein TrbL [bacterium]|nr:P-type conjugative transfer protein TrbL [bacterium]